MFVQGQLYEKLSKAISENEIDELGLLPMMPEAKELPMESQKYYPLVVVESKLGISKSDLVVLLKEAHAKFINLPKDSYKDLEQVTRIMILLKPDNYTAMNRRKELILLGHIDLRQELSLIELIFTIPKHSKSSVAWYHRQWIFTNFNRIELSVDNELKLCTTASTSYPRNYYSWNYRHWILCTYCTQDLPFIEHEYKSTCHWIETHISDYSGFQYLQHLMVMLEFDHKKTEMDQHLYWLNGLIIKYPGHESLWCHRRFCSNMFIHSSDYCNLQHVFILNILNDTFKDQSLSDDLNDMVMQKEFALKFGLWQSLLVSDIRILFYQLIY
ncbi:hypothetical protein INT47_007947 [Mucor saturninus]|uniref:Protein prenyltransferase alpha subunit repeat-containing protein 1 n=1 Tax=Mucor saturninus TaxID=64648 RepID=A0A8H7QTY5_9FUNG|nr:hypothetical protein INT47_007947 [Mucor saturninus]